MHSEYANLSNVACDIFSILPHSVWVEASFSLRRDVMQWRQSKTTCETFGKTVVVTLIAPANNGSLAGDDPALDTTSTESETEMKWEAEQRKLHQMAKVHDILEMWQGSQNLQATQKESHPQNTQMTALGYISDTEELINAFWSNFQHDGAAAFTLSERPPVPPALSTKHLPGVRTHVLNFRWINRIDHHPAESDAHSSPQSISDTKYWLNWNGDLDDPNYSEDDCEADNESDIELDNGGEDSDTPEERNVSAAPNVPRLIRPIRRSKMMAEEALMMVNTMETKRSTGIITR